MGKIGPMSFPLLAAGLPAAELVRAGACGPGPAPAAGPGPFETALGATAASDAEACSRLPGLPIFSPFQSTKLNCRMMTSLMVS